MTNFAGVNAAAVTPRGREGEIDYGAAFELIDLICRAGASGIALFDTAGEYPAFHREERSRLVYLAAKRSRVPLMVGVGSASLADSLALASEARDAGAAALLLPPPFFFPHGQDEIREFYLRFGAQAGDGCSVFIRNPAGAGGNVIAPQTARELLETGLFAGIADACAESVRCVPQSRFLAGDVAFPNARRNGASGAILESACCIPELAVNLDCAIAAGNEYEAERLEALFLEFLTWAEMLPRLVAVKVAAGLRDIQIGPLAIPLSTQRQRDLDRFGEWFRGWLPHAIKRSAHA